MYLRNFWKLLPSLFTLDFWFVNRKLKKLAKEHVGALEIYKAKQWATKHGYSWDNTWYLDGEKFVMKNNCCICMYSPYEQTLTRFYTHMKNFSDKKVPNNTFLLNCNKTANFLLEKFMVTESKILYEREVKYYEMNKRISAEGKDYLDSKEFLLDLHWLSMYNYYDILDLRDNTNYSNKEKREFVGDFDTYSKIDLNNFLSIEEVEEKVKNKEVYKWNWANDTILTALTEEGIDSVLVINPTKLYGVKVTKDLLKRLNKEFFESE